MLPVSDDETDFDDLDDFEGDDVLFVFFSVGEPDISTVPMLSGALPDTVTLPDVQLPTGICCTSESTQSKTV